MIGKDRLQRPFAVLAGTPALFSAHPGSNVSADREDRLDSTVRANVRHKANHVVANAIGGREQYVQEIGFAGVKDAMEMLFPERCGLFWEANLAVALTEEFARRLSGRHFGG